MSCGYTRKVFAGALAVLLSFCVPAYPTDVVDRVIIVVNDEVITQREYNRAFLPIKREIENVFDGDEREERLRMAEEAIKDHLINAKLAISLAKRENITVSEREVAERVEIIRAYYPSDEDFLMALNMQGTNLSEFEREIREQMLAQKLVEEKVSSEIVVTPGEIREVYEKNAEHLMSPQTARVRTIMVRKSHDGKDEGPRKKMEQILEKARRTHDFAALARESSEGPYADEGGDMGDIVPGQMVDEIDSVVFSLGKGQVSDIVETAIGYHLFYIEDTEDPRPLEFAEVSDFLREQVFMRKFQEKLGRYISENREKAHISYR